MPNIVQQHQITRTPIQMMQQQTQSFGNQGSNDHQSSSGSSKKQRIITGSNNITTSASSSTSAAAIAIQNQQMEASSRTQSRSIRKKGKLRDKIIPQKVRDLVPDSQSYMDLMAFESKLDSTIMRKRLDIQEALKRPIKVKRKLRVFITNQYYPSKTDGADGDDESVPQWELKIEGRLLDDNKSEPSLVKTKSRKFSSFFKSLVIELDKELYGPDNHLVEWHRTPQTAETDGFQVKRHGDQSLKSTILMLLDYQPPQFKLDPRLAKLLSIHTATRPVIIQALWQYIKVHKLQDNQEKEFINLDKYLQQIFECDRIRFCDIPNKLHMFCMPPDPIVLNHMIK
jgi:SWI/SNF-related matrix-associated actin-dependent regulator of chromatin subfamily D